MENPNAATPTDDNNGGTPPTTPAATPAPTPETVALPKEEIDQLRRDAARASSNQRKADLYDRFVGSKGNGHFQPTTPAPAPTKEEMEAAAEAEDRKAENGLRALALDPSYRDVLDQDPILRDMFAKNPLGVLPVLAPDALDAEDAITLVKEKLVALRKPAQPAPQTEQPGKATTTPAPQTPPAGGVNPQDSPVNEEVEAARKIPNTERAVAGMIGARLKAGK